MSFNNSEESPDSKKKIKYEGKTIMEEPATIMSLLNTQIINVKANKRYAAYLTADGRVICMGRDYRKKSQA